MFFQGVDHLQPLGELALAERFARLPLGVAALLAVLFRDGVQRERGVAEPFQELAGRAGRLPRTRLAASATRSNQPAGRSVRVSTSPQGWNVIISWSRQPSR